MKNKSIQFIIIFIAVIGVNLLASHFFFRLDLTQEKRYTIADATKNLLQNLDDEVYIKVYLTGKGIPAGFKRLENAVKETLDEFRIYGGSNVKYTFVDLNAEYRDEKTRNERIAAIAKKGITPTNVYNNEDGKKTQSLILPGAIITYKGKEIATLLLKGNKLSSPQEILNQSYEGVEYQLASAIKRVTATQKKKIGFFINYTSLPAVNQLDLIGALKPNYELYPVDLRNSPTLDGLDAIFVLKPDQLFNDDDKYKIDQFIINGGKAIFFVDAVKVDSVAREGNMAQIQNVGLEDLLFKYGVRLNPNLIKDAQMSAAIPLDIGNFGDRSNIQLVQWQYYPLINTFGKSPIVRNLDAIYTKYVGSLDTVRADGITKVPLLMTSQYTQLLHAPAIMSYNFASKDLNANQYKGGVQTVGILLEGKFESLFKNRILPSDPRFATFKAEGKDSKIIVCSDGDIPVNDFDQKHNAPLPLGFDKYSGNTFANKDFVLNAIDYLLDDNGVIVARNKEIKLRPLDKAALQDERTYWQSINLIVPVIILVVLGLARNFWRQRKYTR
ncbi:MULTISPECIES: gliding motility-associated ABC transporter substrate-binding protein GldG [unclassified Arcicella]|uniref:gliding motility-associated ABC transporter substrate-binding protein GldG n=1 Tax=unclassified Arcicella TaxID=2644986 RepID=UPI00286222CE|nr:MULTISPECIES: gliding motility-associated ABC transporter substrate-binding protein GldG [unclassified Arcicella]MDR6560005.1 gliding-associated putative ABC transporter substrate-binding component GldG [Arcicella sp. BE51]MDR6810388.1 gliding-associated putative ABC transporter substrate-binding component GldG [Arcicella sp. BE140]MDR6821738.1 gliding-associated putative ABC transporter substrate-binding component GldG [Arcicella sp. BE139]